MYRPVNQEKRLVTCEADMIVGVRSDKAGAKDKVHAVQTLTAWAAVWQDLTPPAISIWV